LIDASHHTIHNHTHTTPNTNTHLQLIIHTPNSHSLVLPLGAGSSDFQLRGGGPETGRRGEDFFGTGRRQHREPHVADTLLIHSHIRLPVNRIDFLLFSVRG